MNTFVYTSDGKKSEAAKAPSLFDSTVREDIVAKAVESERFETAQPYGLYKEAGRRHSASGTISHQRHQWKGHYGKGISRVPRKTMWRRGTQFYWIAAEVSGTRGGRRVHGPTIFKHARKINSQEKTIALKSALAATAQERYLAQRNPSLKGISGVHVISQLPQKTGDLVALISKVFNTVKATPQKKVTRSGVGKSRGRRYKTNAGALLVTSSSEKAKYKHVDVKTVKQLSLLDLYPLGRMTLFTEKALEEIQNAI